MLGMYDFYCSRFVPDNYVHDMQDAGLANLESFDSEVYDNTFENVKYGIRISLGGSNNYIHDNTFSNCSKCEYTCDVVRLVVAS